MEKLIIPNVGDWVTALAKSACIECESPLKVLGINFEKMTFQYAYFAEPDWCGEDDEDKYEDVIECIGEDETSISKIIEIIKDPEKIALWELKMR